MRCDEAEGLLAPHISEGLDDATEREVALHLDGCAACRARLQQEYELNRLILAAVSRGTSRVDSLVQRIETALDGMPAHPRLVFPGRWAILAGSAAVVLLFAVAIVRFTASDPMHLLCQDAVDDHRTEVVQHEPRHWQTGRTEITDLARRTIPGMKLPERVAGLPLEKGRICGLLQATALHLVYGQGSREVSVFFMLRRELPSDSLPWPNSASSVHQETQSGIAAASFADGRMGIVVVGDSSLAHNAATQLAGSL